MIDIVQSTKACEDWLRRALGSEVVEKDLVRKHEKMNESPFAFLRATYWRWAEVVYEVCPETADAPSVLAVGDIHLENFGTWRDTEGRLAWGVNDFDEAAEMPYLLDLVRLATSALVASGRRGAAAEQLCAALLKGYREGLRAPGAIVLDRDRQWLYELLAVSAKQRAKFWEKIEAAKPESAPPRYRKALADAMPEKGLDMTTARRVAGAGSLGRPRWVAMAHWNGAPVVREAKAVLTSSWYRVPGRGTAKIRCGAIVAGRFRAADPWHRLDGGIVVRRLSPNNRKIEAGKSLPELLSPSMLEVMGLELANVHLGTHDHRAAIERDLKRRKPGWLYAFARAMATATGRDFKNWTAVA